jgi:hypothetical protein
MTKLYKFIAARVFCTLLALSAITSLAHGEAVIPPKSPADCAQDAACVFDRSVEAGLVPAWQAQARLKIVKGKRERLREGVAHNLREADSRDSMRLFRFDEPTDVAGIAFLIHENSGGDDDIWMYLPSMQKTRRILSSGKNDSFMGSDFSYADLMAPRTADYRHQLLSESDCLDPDLPSCYLLDSVVISAKTAKSLGYSRVKTWIKPEVYLPYRIEYFDRNDELYKFQELSEFIPSEQTWIASQRWMTDIKAKSRSHLHLTEVVTDVKYDPNQFTERRLSKVSD